MRLILPRARVSIGRENPVGTRSVSGKIRYDLGREKRGYFRKKRKFRVAIARADLLKAV